MEKKTLVDHVEVKRDGVMQIRFRKVLIEDDGSVTELGYHRTAVMPGDDVTAQLDMVDASLVRDLKSGSLPAEDKAFVLEVKDAMWTEERVTEFQDAKAARDAAKPQATGEVL